MISFENDYSTGAHPRILEALTATNLEPAPGYGSDRFCEIAAARIRAACDNETADVFFLTGGTQTNTVVISALLAGHEGVIAADTGHIAVHEAGAIEATGHKVLTVPECDGKLRAADETIRIEPSAAGELDVDGLMQELSDDEVVRVKTIEFEPLTEEEALVKIDLLGHDFFAYTDRDSGLVNVLYRRDDGGYGLLKQAEE